MEIQDTGQGVGDGSSESDVGAKGSPGQPVGPLWAPPPLEGIEEVRAVWVSEQDPVSRWIEGIAIHCVAWTLISVGVFTAGLMVGRWFS